MQITKQQAVQLINSNNGRVFGAVYTARKMVCNLFD